MSLSEWYAFTLTQLPTMTMMMMVMVLLIVNQCKWQLHRYIHEFKLYMYACLTWFQ